jgi:hypothetical protein
LLLITKIGGRMPIYEYRCTKCGRGYTRFEQDEKKLPSSFPCEDTDCFGIAMRVLSLTSIGRSLSDRDFPMDPSLMEPDEVIEYLGSLHLFAKRKKS